MLKNPLTMQGRIDRCWLFTYEADPRELAALVPSPLELVTHHGRAYWNVVVCHVRKMRPWPLPAVLGASYWHVAYRLYVRCHPAMGEPLEGLYFVRSDCDHRLMTAGGRQLTDFNFHNAGVQVQEKGTQTRIVVASREAPAEVVIDRALPARLREGSVFGTLEEAAAALKYRPAGISVSPQGIVSAVRITRDEAAWQACLVHTPQVDWGFFHGKAVQPEIVYEVAPIDYVWNRGRKIACHTARQAGKTASAVS